jgi:D-alanine-D-alanine ligase
MHICVLSSQSDPGDTPYDPSSYFVEHEWDHFLPDPINFKTEIDQLIKVGYDVFVNLCDGTPDDELSGIGLVKYLEERGVAFTGASSSFFDPTRPEMKLAALRAGVPVPGTKLIHQIQDLSTFDHQLQFPLLVKPPHGYASFGISRDSRVINLDTLKSQVDLTLKAFGGALVEEFIEGREFTTLIAENSHDHYSPITFQPVEFKFPPGESFKHFDMKWKDYERMSVFPVRDADIDYQLRDFTKRQFISMNGNGYARCDFRMDATGNLFLLEINPNCGVFYPPNEPGSADHILINDPLGHRGFLNLILQSAMLKKRCD